MFESRDAFLARLQILDSKRSFLDDVNLSAFLVRARSPGHTANQAAKGWRPPRPPVLAIYGASGRPPTIKPRLAPSLARVRSGGRGRAAIFSPSRARTPSLSACHKESESHRWSAGWWRGVVTGCHPVAFSLRAARKIPQTLLVTIPGAASVPDARKAPAPPLFRSCAAAAGGISTAITRFDLRIACTVAGRPKYTPPPSGALAVELESSQACCFSVSIN